MKKAIPYYVILVLGFICINHYTASAGPSGGPEEIRSNLYVRPASGAPVLLDGNLTQYDASFSNNLDGLDARKMSNFSENIGMLRGNYVLVVERRHTIDINDTIFYKLWQLQQRPYQLEFVTTNLDHPGLEGYLEDNYLQTSTPVQLNGTTTVDFSINSDPASKATDRFRLIFSMPAAAPLPLTITYFDAHRTNKDVHLDWTTENENNLKSFDVQRSADGMNYSLISQVTPRNAAINKYAITDQIIEPGNKYYRLIISEKDGKTRFSNVVKVYVSDDRPSIILYPNPAADNHFHFVFHNQSKGIYQLRLFNGLGQILFDKRLQHTGGDIIQDIRPDQHLKRGVYQFEITTPDRKFSQMVSF